MSEVAEHTRLAYRYTELADRIGVHPDTVRSWCRSGKIRSTRIGGVVVIPAVEVDRLLAGDAV